MSEGRESGDEPEGQGDRPAFFEGSAFPVVVELVEPRVCSGPDGDRDLGRRAVEWARRNGMTLDPEQELVLERSLATGPDGRYLAFEVAVNEARQNGKGEILIAREGFGLFELGDPWIVHTAHEFKTSARHFRRFEALVKRSPELLAQVKRAPSGRVVGFRYGNGDESIELQDDRRIDFRTRTSSAMRGYDDVSLLVLDEAMILQEGAHGTMLPTMRANTSPRGPQLWYTGSAVDQELHQHGTVFTRIRNRGIVGDDPDLVYFEWSLPFEHPDEVPDEVYLDPEMWKLANPAIVRGRVLVAHMERERRSMSRRSFLVELCTVGDYPDVDGEATVIPLELWESLAEPDARIVGRPVFAFDVNPSRTWASIGVAGRLDDGRFHVDVADRREGTKWLAPRMKELVGTWRPVAVVCDSVGPAASLVADLEREGVKVKTLTTGEYAEACGQFYDAAMESGMSHAAHVDLDSALVAAAQRQVGERWLWDRKSSGDISPLVAVTQALGTVAAQPALRPVVAFAKGR